jgi:uncharacterized protein with ParB-like and HNH nuclease domain
MKAEKSSVWDLFNGAKQYVVPLFQRPYVWSRAQWEQLWADIIEQYEIQEERPQERIPDRFLGSIVVVREYEKNLDKYTIIDGQQRITTLSIILAAIRAFAKERNQNELYEQISDFLRNSPRSGEGQYVVVPTRNDKPALYHIFNEDYSFEQDSRIVECFDFFWRKIDESPGVSTTLLQQVITENLCVIYIELDQGENPNQVFEALNYRGVPLEESDLIRNFFFAALESPAVAEEQYDLFWKPMEERFEYRQELLSHFIRYFFMRNGETVRIGELFENVRKKYHGVSPDEIRLLLQELNRYSGYFLHLLYPELYPVKDDVSGAIQQYLMRIRDLGADAASPFLMLCFARNDQAGSESGQVSDQELSAVLHLIESYLVRRAICRRPDTGYEEVFAALCREMSPPSPEIAGRVRATLLRVNEQLRMPDDDEFDDHLRHSDLFEVSGENMLARIVMTALEEFFSAQSPASEPLAGIDLFDDQPKRQMIDHVMPCTLSHWWRDHLGPDWETVHQDYLHRLGNLTLTMENPAIVNADFDTKKAWYSLDNHLLNISMKSIRQWRKFQIDQRSGVLAAFCKKIWPYPEGETGVSALANAPSSPGLRTGEIRKSAKPATVEILGDAYQVKYWYQVLEVTIRVIYDREPQKFERIVREWPAYFSEEPGSFKSAVGPYRFKSRFGRYQIRDMCMEMVRLVGWSDSSWSLEIQ